jgi:hypothetical protein
MRKAKSKAWGLLRQKGKYHAIHGADVVWRGTTAELGETLAAVKGPGAGKSTATSKAGELLAQGTRAVGVGAAGQHGGRGP